MPRVHRGGLSETFSEDTARSNSLLPLLVIYVLFCLLAYLSVLTSTFKPHFLQDVQFSKSHDKEPTIILTPNHESEGNNLKPTYMSVAAWIEVSLCLYSLLFVVQRNIFLCA